MSEPSLRDIDLNLLVILDVLLQERSVSRSSERLHITPSAVSHALKRLRTLFDDELLVRNGRQMAPTTRARELSDALPRALRHLASTLAKPEPFNPATSNRTFRVVAPDFAAPAIFSEIGREAPLVRVEWVARSQRVIRELAQGHYDAFVTFGKHTDEGVRAKPVGECTWSVYGRAGHPAFDQWSTQAWSAYPHIQVGTTLKTAEGPVEIQTKKLGLVRRVGAVVPYFSMVPPVLAQTDLLFTIPRICIESTQKTYDLESHEVPFSLPNVTLCVYRSATHGDDTSVRWFLERIESACRTL